MTKPLPPDFNEVLRLKHIFGPGAQPLSIIPILREKKIPACKWKDAIDNGPWSDERLAQIWSQYADINPGVACGPLSGPRGLVVVDGDNAEALAWMAEHLAPTPMRTRTRKGEHWYYAYPRDGGEHGNRADILGSKARFESEALAAGFDVRMHARSTPEEQGEERERCRQARVDAQKARVPIGPVIDVRGRGGQVVLPGALGSRDFRYQEIEPWHAGMELPTFDPRVVEGRRWQRPAATGGDDAERLLARQREDFLTEARARSTGDERVRRARAYLANIEGAVSGANGHNKLFYAACQLVIGFELGESEALDLLLSDYNSRCQPEWSYAEIAHKVADAARQLTADSGHLLPDSARWTAMQSCRTIARYEPLLDEALPATTTAPAAPVAAVIERPNPRPVNHAPPTDDELQWHGLWRERGVDYAQVADLEWERKKEMGGKVWTLPPTTNNISLVLRFGHESRRWLLAYNRQKMVRECNGRPLTDGDEREIHGRICYLWQQEVSMERVLSAVYRACDANAHDPWQTFAARLPEWDGGDHLATFIAEVLGIDPRTRGDAYDQAYREWRHQLTGAMARGLVPGTKVQTIMIIVGRQGRRKSQLLHDLFNGRGEGWDFFTDQKFRLDDKDGQMLISGYHACEWSEAEHAKNPKAIDTIKAFLGQTTDVFRPPFERNIVHRPRRVVFFGTSNEAKGLLHDVTGNRRFYITDIGAHDIDLPLLLRIRSQLWAQIRAYHDWYQAAVVAGDAEGQRACCWWYDSEDEAARQASLSPYTAESAFHEFVESWLSRRRDPFIVQTVFTECLGLDPGHVSNAQKKDMRDTLLRLGAVEPKGGRARRFKGELGRWWQPPPPVAEDEDGEQAMDTATRVIAPEDDDEF